MITEIEKKECDKFYLPNGLYYKLQKDTLKNRIKDLDNDFENISQYATALKNLIQSNGLRFFYEIKDLDRVKFIDAINTQFDYYSETETNMYRWLNLTYDLIIKGFSIAGTVDIEKQSDFKKWFNEKIRTNEYYEYEIVSHIIGQRNNMNSPFTQQPCYHYIKDVLKKYQLNSIKATEMVNDFKGSFSPDWNKNVIPFVIDYLKSIDVNNEPQQSTKEPESIESKEPTLKQLALYHVYLGTKINKDNANDYLRDTTHKSGGKLKQEFDKYNITNNRIYSGTDRENSFRLKLFKSVIEMLKKTSNEDAIKNAENELNQFEKTIA